MKAAPLSTRSALLALMINNSGPSWEAPATSETKAAGGSAALIGPRRRSRIGAVDARRSACKQAHLLHGEEPRRRRETWETVTVATRCAAQLFSSIDGVITAPSQARGHVFNT